MDPNERMNNNLISIILKISNTYMCQSDINMTILILADCIVINTYEASLENRKANVV